MWNHSMQGWHDHASKDISEGQVLDHRGEWAETGHTAKERRQWLDLPGQERSETGIPHTGKPVRTIWLGHICRGHLSASQRTKD